MVPELEVTLRNDLQEIPRLAVAVDAFGESLGVEPSVIYHFNLAFDELITNTVSYGYDDEDEHLLRVRLWRDDGRLCAEFSDDGRPFDPLTEAPPPELESPLEERRIGGLGIHLIRSLMDEMSYRLEGGRNHISFCKRLSGAGAGTHD